MLHIKINMKEIAGDRCPFIRNSLFGSAIPKLHFQLRISSSFIATFFAFIFPQPKDCNLLLHKKSEMLFLHISQNISSRIYLLEKNYIAMRIFASILLVLLIVAVVNANFRETCDKPILYRMKREERGQG